MALDLSRLSDEMESALAGARMLAEERRQAIIQPEHLILLLLESDPSSLRTLLEKPSRWCFRRCWTPFPAAPTSFQPSVWKRAAGPLASQPLRTLLQESFRISETHGRPSAEPADVLEAALTTGTNDIRNDFRKAGFTVDDLPKGTVAPSVYGRGSRGCEGRC